jgi:hypothetical protein
MKEDVRTEITALQWELMQLGCDMARMMGAVADFLIE